MKIRKIKKDDLLECSSILEEAYSKKPYKEKFQGSNALEYISIKYNHCKKNSFVVILNNKIVGFIFITISTWSDGPQAILEEIVVNPDNQRNGIGKKLLEYAQNYLNKIGIKSVMLWAKNDKRLINFYKRQGYFIADDFIVMFKNF